MISSWTLRSFPNTHSSCVMRPPDLTTVRTVSEEEELPQVFKGPRCLPGCDGGEESLHGESLLEMSFKGGISCCGEKGQMGCLPQRTECTCQGKVAGSVILVHGSQSWLPIRITQNTCPRQHLIQHICPARCWPPASILPVAQP